jgi:basic membrane protein A
MKRFLAFILVAVMLFSAAACAAPANVPETPDTEVPESEEPTAAPEEPASEEPEAAGFTCIVSESAAGAPFSKLTWKGFEQIESETGTKVQFVEALEPAEFEEQLRAMADLGANPIYSMFDGVNLVAADIADEYPDTQFILIDSNEKQNQPNVTNIIVDSFEPSFVAGLVAAMTTKTGKVGWVGCLDIPVITRFYDGFAAGVKYANETYGLNVTSEKVYIGDAADTVKGAETAKLLIDKGVDVIYHAANEAGLGVIQACVEANVKCIGVDEWQGSINELVYWSALIAINDAVYDSYNRYVGGTLESGELSYGIKTGSPIYDQRDYDKLPDDVKAAVDTLMAGVNDGTIDVFSYAG